MEGGNGMVAEMKVEKKNIKKGKKQKGGKKGKHYKKPGMISVGKEALVLASRGGWGGAGWEEEGC